MLVLTRRPQQSIMIGDDIVVTVLEVKGDQIRIGITAPRSVQVYREEVLVAMSEANRGALLTDGAAVPPAPQRDAAVRPATVSSRSSYRAPARRAGGVTTRRAA
ncbi:MAG: Carbon storage regulator [Mycobacterium sp.]|jgi:carbon storage regulator|nr:Carbon storage regulator [Mycobacterium sp.]